MFCLMSAKETIHDPSTQRQRTIEHWCVVGAKAHNPDITIYRLNGVTVLDGGKEVETLRFTNTSPIKKVEAGLVTTASGSTYKLGKPSQHYIDMLIDNGQQYTEQDPIPTQFQ